MFCQKLFKENPDSPNTEVLIRLSLQKLAQKVKIMTEIRLIDGHSHEGKAMKDLKLLLTLQGKLAFEAISVSLFRQRKNRKEALDHVLLFGPPGLGKTTLAQIIAKEMNVGFRSTSGPVITKAVI